MRAHVHRDAPAADGAPARERALLFERCWGGAAHAEVAREEHTTRNQVTRAFSDGGDKPLARREQRPPRRLSLDEAAHRSGHELATVVSDLDRRRVIEVLDGRSRRVAERYLRALAREQRAAIDVVSIDPYEAYRQAIGPAACDQLRCPTQAAAERHLRLHPGSVLVRGTDLGPGARPVPLGFRLGIG